jgi:putative oxidoreductase
MKSLCEDPQTWIKGFRFVVCVALGCMFLWSALPKIQRPYDFLSNVYSFELVNPRLGMLVAMALPWVELLVGICLLGGIFVGGALLSSVGMAAMFTFVLSWALVQRLDISCGCFGSGTDKVTYLTLTRALIILLFSAAAYAMFILCRNRGTS